MTEPNRHNSRGQATTELLLLPNGQILAHNLTPAMAEVLAQLDPTDRLMKQRAERKMASRIMSKSRSKSKNWTARPAAFSTVSELTTDT